MATVTDPRNPIKTRKATRPATGVCRWLTKPNARHEGGVLQINGTAYERPARVRRRGPGRLSAAEGRRRDVRPALRPERLRLPRRDLPPGAPRRLQARPGPACRPGGAGPVATRPPGRGRPPLPRSG